MSIFLRTLFSPRTPEPFIPATLISSQPQTSPLATLPPEILILIAHHLSNRRDPHARRTLIARSDLSSLASASKSLRRLLLPLMFADTKVGSSSRLLSLAQAPVHILALIRNFTILVDLEFYDKLALALSQAKNSPLHHDRQVQTKQSIKSPTGGVAPATSGALPELRRDVDSTKPFYSHHDSAAPLHALSTILVRIAPTLRSFAFSMHSQPGSTGSAWSQFPKSSMSGIAFAGVLVAYMRTEWQDRRSAALHNLETAEDDNQSDAESVEALLSDDLTFPHLTTLSIDGTAEIAPFLQLVPNLVKLRLRIPEGFNPRDCRTIVDSLPCVPQLNALELWVSELGSDDQVRTSVLADIGMSCPRIQVLNFQTRSYNYADGMMSLRPSTDKGFHWRDILPVMHQFPKLQELHLPGTLSEEDVPDEVTPVNTPSDVDNAFGTLSAGRPRLSPPPSSAPSTIQDLELTASTHLVESAFRCGGVLSTVSWVRPDHHEPIEYEVTGSPLPGKLSVRPSVKPVSKATWLEYQSSALDSDFYDSFCHDFYDIDVKSTSSTSLATSVSVFFTTCVLSAYSAFFAPRLPSNNVLPESDDKLAKPSLTGELPPLVVPSCLSILFLVRSWNPITSLTDTLCTLSSCSSEIGTKCGSSIVNKMLQLYPDIDLVSAMRLSSYVMVSAVASILGCLLLLYIFALVISRANSSCPISLHG